MKSSKNRGKRELVHPIFLECRDRCDNEFWKSLYEDMAYGKYPKQMYINQHQQIQSTNRSMSFQYSFKDKTVDEMVHDIQELLLAHTNLISNEEINQKKTNSLPYKKDNWASWKDIKKKYIRDILLMDYCIEIKKKLHFTSGEISYLYIILNHMLSHGQLYEVNIIDNKIESIEGVDLRIEDQLIYIYCDPPREDLLYPIPDMMSHYCKRHLLRIAKLAQDAKKNE